MEQTRKIVGMGEAILDILFRDGQPVAAVNGGSSFNSIISVGRAGIPCSFVGYTGADHVGRQTVRFMHDNGVGTEHFLLQQGEKSAISLAFIAEGGDANYLFYKEPPHTAFDWTLPDMHRGDVLLFGSYYAACKDMRPLVGKMLRHATASNAIVCYDLNFRRNHRGERESLMPFIRENLQHSTIVRSSADDIEVLFDARDARDIYIRYIKPYCPVFICTAGAGNVTVCTPAGCLDFQAPPLRDIVSTVGAGDSFNAGLACGLVWQGIMPEDIAPLDENRWQQLVGTACSFAAETCRSTENYINPHHSH